MSNPTNSRASSRGSLFRAAPLPEEPGPADSWPDRGTLLRAQAEALGALVREDLSRGRGLAFFVCSAVLTLVAVLVPVLVVDVATSEDGDATGAAATAVGACLLLAVVALPALLVLRFLRARGVRRAQLLRQWAAVDRGHDSAFLAGYGSQGIPHPRFINAAVLLAVAFFLTALAVVNASDADGLVMVPGLVVAACFAWATVAKYANRYGWASRENTIRGRERRRLQHRGTVSGVTEVRGTGGGIRPALLYVALFAPLAVVVVVFAIVRPKDVLGLVVVGLIALAVLVIGFPSVVLRRRRERAQLAGATSALSASFAPGTVVHPVRYGLGEPDGRRVAEGPAAWDCGPPRAGVLAIGTGVLSLRGADGSALDLPMSDLVGVACIEGPVAWLDPSLDLLLGSGDSIELRTAHAKEFADALSGAGVRTVAA